MRTFEKTHPWLSFQIDLRKAPYTLWHTLGEAQSKCENIAGVPLEPETAKSLHNIYLAKGALSTTAIEGNTLSEEEVRRRIAGDLKLPPSKEYLGKEIDNVVAAVNLIVGRVFQTDGDEVTVDEIKEYNRMVLKDLPLQEGVAPGEYRNYSVGVGRYRGAPDEDCAVLMAKLASWLDEEGFNPPEGMRVTFGLIKAVLAHLYLAWIHAFGDGNGRTARLVEFKILLASGVPTPAAHLLSNHYNQTRTEYYRQLDFASSSGGDVFPFIEYAVRGFVDGLREQLELIREQQLNVAWRNFVHETFKDKISKAEIRQRHLVLDLSLQPKPVPVVKLAGISPRIAVAYAGKTRKTFARDLNTLKELGLIEQTSEGVRARREMILAFLPHRRTTK